MDYEVILEALGIVIGGHIAAWALIPVLEKLPVAKYLGLEEKTAKLETLEIEFKLKYYEENFIDDGFVESVEKRLNNLFPNGKHKRDKKIRGVCINDFESVHIFYEDSGDYQLNKAIRAHEETHALDYFGRLNLLEQKILSESGIKIDFSKIDDEELKANIGAIHILKQNNGGEIPINPPFNNTPSYMKAFDHYTNCQKNY